MAAMLTLFGCPNTRSARAAWALEETGAEYEYVKVDLFKGEGRRPPYLDLNPGGGIHLSRDGFPGSAGILPAVDWR